MTIKRVDRLSVNDINTTMEVNRQGLLESSTPKEALAVSGVFVAQHDLGVKPDPKEWMIQYSAEANIAVWATTNNKRAWNKNSVQLTGSASGRVYVWLVRRT